MDAESLANDNGDRLFEHRGQSRYRVLLAGKLGYPDSAVTADCSIRNLSESGAMIITPDIALPNDPFLIVIKQAYLHAARTAWQRGATSGLSFLSSWRLTDGGRGGVAPLRSLW